jgi:hypothetical protein
MIASGVSQSEGVWSRTTTRSSRSTTCSTSFYLHLGIGGRLRTDQPVKVFKFNTENDVLGLGEGAARQDDSAVLHTWEIAGASHVNYWENLTRSADGYP